jgi:hypothetical protein
MGIGNVVSQPVTNDPHRLGGVAPTNNGKRRRAARDRAADQRLHAKLMNWYLQERDKQSYNRYQMAIDEDFYDGLQWSDEDAQELISRGQAPLVFNQIKPTINWMLGTERRTRIDGKVLPREESDETAAETKTKLLKYLSDVNRTPFTRSQAWKSCIVAGLGWMEDSINRDPTEELLSTRYESWRSIYYDSNSTEMDLSDARYLFRWRYLDLDVALALCPDREAEIRKAAIENEALANDEDDVYYLGARVNTQTTGDFAHFNRRTGFNSYGTVNNTRERVKIIECWYRVPTACKMCRGGDFHGEVYDPNNEDMVAAVEDGYTSIATHTRMEMRCALMTEGDLLYEGLSPYKHNRFPFTPMWCYRRHRDNMPYGVIRDIRDAQEDYNKRASKALFILSTVRVIMDEHAVEDIEETRREIARPDAILVVKKDRRFEIDQDKSLAEEHIKLMMFDGQMIRDVGGVTDQNLGKDDKGLSGQAIGKLQDQGTIVTAALFDNMRLAIQLQSEIQLSLLEQYYTAPKVVRIIGENKPIEWLKINVYDEAADRYLNDITARAADFIVSEQDFKASIRQAMFESMMDLVSKLPPEVGLKLLDMVVDFADVPNKDELVKRIRAINGQADPSRKPTPEEQAQLQEAQRKQEELEQIQTDTLRATLEKTQAEAQKIVADAKRMEAEIQKSVASAIEMGVKAAYEALQAAQIVSTIPNVTPVADAILAGAGYQDQGGKDPNIPGPTGELPAMTAQPMHGSYVGEAAGGAAPELQQTDGLATGIETPTGTDGIRTDLPTDGGQDGQ